MFKDVKKVLVIAPHTDDAEFGCGGTISKLVSEGVDVYCAAFSACEISVISDFPKDILITEVKKATSVLGIPKQNLYLFKYQVRTFNFRRQDILEDLINLRNEIKPDLIFIPSINDTHQDHATICDEGIRAFKFSSILCYEMPWNNFNFTTTCFFQLSEEHLNKKITAMEVYKSQQHRPYSNKEFIRSLAITRGVQSGSRYAEVFEVIRLLVK